MVIKITEAVAHKAIKYGMADTPANAEVEIKRLLDQSAPLTHYLGTKRYEDWIFKLDGAVVIDLHLITCTICDDRKRVPVYEVCDDCGGKRCKRCRWRGEIRRLIPCPNCTN